MLFYGGHIHKVWVSEITPELKYNFTQKWGAEYCFNEKFNTPEEAIKAYEKAYALIRKNKIIRTN